MPGEKEKTDTDRNHTQKQYPFTERAKQINIDIEASGFFLCVFGLLSLKLLFFNALCTVIPLPSFTPPPLVHSRRVLIRFTLCHQRISCSSPAMTIGDRAKKEHRRIGSSI